MNYAEADLEAIRAGDFPLFRTEDASFIALMAKLYNWVRTKNRDVF